LQSWTLFEAVGTVRSVMGAQPLERELERVPQSGPEWAPAPVDRGEGCAPPSRATWHSRSTRRPRSSGGYP
jgi:hypothetical protein